MTGILSLFVVLLLSMIVSRVGSVALSLTGLNYEVARFQARSALTSTGFTTVEAEDVVNYPIVMALMTAGSLGFVSVLA